MNFTPKNNVRPVINGMLTIAVVGLIGWVSRVASHPHQWLQDRTLSQCRNPSKQVTPYRSCPRSGTVTGRPPNGQARTTINLYLLV